MCSNKIITADDGGEQQQKAQQLDEPKKKGMALLCYDLKLKQLIPIKILFFVISAGKSIIYFSLSYLNGLTLFLCCFTAIGVILPYMTLHMRSLGITVEEIGIIYGIVPFAAILAPSAMGMIADKIGNFKVSMMTFIDISDHIIINFYSVET